MYTGGPKKSFSVWVLGAEGTIVFQFSQSRCHWKALYFKL